MEKLEIQKLRDLPIEGVAERLGMQIVRHKALCPFHDDHHASLSFSMRRNTFRCFACGAHGGTIDLVMRYLNKTFTEACWWLQNKEPLPLAPIPSDARPPVAFPCMEGSNYLQEQVVFDSSRYERFFERPWLLPEARRFLFEERRLDPRVVRWCRLTSWKDRKEVPWLQIPYYDQEGRLVGVQNRNLVRGGLPRFRFPQGSECGIYNLPVLKRLRPGDELWIAEGCSDCWALLSAGHKAIAIPSATLLTKKDKELLSGLSSLSKNTSVSSCLRVPLNIPALEPPLIKGLKTSGLSLGLGLSLSFHMYPDQDAPGERLFLQLQKVLPTLVHHQLPEGCKDYGEYYKRETLPPAPP